MKKLLACAITAAALSPTVNADFIYRTPAGMQVGSGASEEASGSSPLPSKPSYSSDCAGASIGDSCMINDDSVIYAGDLSGERIYMASNTEPENGYFGLRGYSYGSVLGDGYGNTPKMIGGLFDHQGSSNPISGSTYVNNIATMCTSHGSNWYVPSESELSTAFTNLSHNLSGLGFATNLTYITSTEHGTLYAKGLRPQNSTAPAVDYLDRSHQNPIRCFVKDTEKKLLAVGPRNNVAHNGINGLTDASFTASSNYSSDYAYSAFDGGDYNNAGFDYGTLLGYKNRSIWLVYRGQDEWIQVDFGDRKVNAAGIVIRNPSLYPSWLTYMPKDVTVQASNDGVTFHDVKSFNDLPQEPMSTLTFDSPVYAQYIRLVVHSNYGNTYIQIGEIEVFE
ncbi:discoidin domain-containing protein [Neptuniibacter sp. QD37_11]|uniref:discoidin domain-containing protein n=1 Tax=Neptuniibacter sp. QD37_11 TaxID=3398209 RepID=UPI0039F548E1